MNNLATDILDSLPDPVLLLDAGRVVTRINPAARAVLGDPALGRDLSHSLRHPDALRAVDAVLTEGGQHGVEVSLPVPIARAFDLQALAAPGGQGGVLVIMRDVTALRQNERMRADFVSNVSHELRSLRRTLIGFIETLRGPAANDPEARTRFLEIMDAEAARMSRLVDDLLSLARVEAREHIQPETELDLAPLLKGVAETLAARSDRPVALDIADGLPPVLARPGRTHAGFREPAGQCDKVWRRQRAAGSGGSRAHSRYRPSRRLHRGDRRRPRHRRGRPAPPDRAFLPHRQGPLPEPRRHRARPRYRETHRQPPPAGW